MTPPLLAPPYLLTELGNIEEWACDYNGHLNEGYALVLLSRATDTLLDAIGLDAASREQRQFSAFTLQNILHYRQEGRLGQRLQASSQLLAYDEKRLRIYHQLLNSESGETLVEMETLLIGVDMQQRRSAPWPREIEQALFALSQQQAQLPIPERAGGAISRPALPL